MASAPAPLSSLALVRHTDAVVDLFGRFDLCDAELRAVRVGLAPGNVPTLEAELHLSGALAVAGAPADPEAEYRVILRCIDVAELSLADFEHQNVVTAWAVTPAAPHDPDGRNVHLSLTGGPGCDLDLRCAAIDVVAVDRVPAGDPI
jgi:hypothetical protein